MFRLTTRTDKHHAAIVTPLHEAYLNNPLAKFVSGSKLSALANGYMSRTTTWDKLVWRGMRNGQLRGLAGDKLRALVVVGGEYPVCTLTRGRLDRRLTGRLSQYRTSGSRQLAPLYSHIPYINMSPVRRASDCDTLLRPTDTRSRCLHVIRSFER